MTLTALVCGSREGEYFLKGGHPFGVTTLALNIFDVHHGPIGHVVVGSEKGFDRHGLEWARANDRPWTVWPAKWKALGKQAGPIRNAEQLTYLIRITEAASRVCLAFPGENGTEDMVAKAMRASVPVWRCLIDGKHFQWVRQ